MNAWNIPLIIHRIITKLTLASSKDVRNLRIVPVTSPQWNVKRRPTIVLPVNPRAIELWVAASLIGARELTRHTHAVYLQRRAAIVTQRGV